MRALFILLFFLIISGTSDLCGQQLADCTLGLGGKDAKTIIEIFQLNEEQQAKMEAWTAELQTQNKLIEDQIQELYAKHPQSTPEELNDLAGKFSSLKDLMVQKSKQYDLKLLALFNSLQYQRYEALCNAALRRPMEVPVKLKDSIGPE